MPRPRAIVLRAPGTNCEEETAHAWQKAGAEVETWHVGRLFEAPQGFSKLPPEAVAPLLGIKLKSAAH